MDKAKYLIAFLLMVLSGCGNPLNRQSNPLKGYNSQNDVPYINGVAQVPHHQNLFCKQPYQLMVMAENDQGVDSTASMPLQFTVEETGVYHIYMLSRVKTSLQLQNAPNGMQLNQLDNQRWELRWFPSRNQSKLHPDLELVANSGDGCGQELLPVKIPVVVTTSSLQPVITIQGLDSTHPFSSGQSIAFTLEFTDPSLHGNETPPSIRFTFPATSGNQSVRLNATAKNIRCGKLQNENKLPPTFRQDCAISADEIIRLNDKKKGIGTLTVDASVTSALGGTSKPAKISVSIVLPDTPVNPQPAPMPKTLNLFKSKQKGASQ